jgi:type II secretory pathway pseudopilin PulG
MRVPDRVARAFTLIEILISVLILALGVLGLGALFPVVIKQQRNGADATYGVIAAEAAKSTLETIDYRAALPAFIGTPPDNREVWLDWRNKATGLNQPTFERGQWFVPAIDTVNNMPSALEIGNPGSNSAFLLSIRERLYPTASPTGPDPQFVWDLAVHRVSDFDNTTDATLDPLEVVVFVRRIDQRIRLAAPATSLFQALTDPAAGAGRRRPVGIDTQNVPTLDGTGMYARPITASVTYYYNPPSDLVRDRLHLVPPPPANVLPLIKQGGQRLVDNVGNVYTVIGSGTDTNGLYVQVNPPVPASTVGLTSPTITQVVFTPQVPAAVLLFKVNP